MHAGKDESLQVIRPSLLQPLSENQGASSVASGQFISCSFQGAHQQIATELRIECVYEVWGVCGRSCAIQL